MPVSSSTKGTHKPLSTKSSLGKNLVRAAVEGLLFAAKASEGALERGEKPQFLERCYGDKPFSFWGSHVPVPSEKHTCNVYKTRWTLSNVLLITLSDTYKALKPGEKTKLHICHGEDAIKWQQNYLLNPPNEEGICFTKIERKAPSSLRRGYKGAKKAKFPLGNAGNN